VRALTAALVVAALLAAVAGCGGSDGRVTRAELPKTVLQPGDLGASFERFDEGRQGLVEQPRGSRSDPARFGRIVGWKARYRRPGTAQTRGPLVVESRADLYDGDGDGADEDLAAVADQLREGAGRPLPAPDVGEEAFLWQASQAGSPRRVLTVVCAWREGSVLATVTATGFEGRLRAADVVALARLQQARIAAAAD
jgi:hypothetical protein